MLCFSLCTSSVLRERLRSLAVLCCAATAWRSVSTEGAASIGHRCTRMASKEELQIAHILRAWGTEVSQERGVWKRDCSSFIYICGNTLLGGSLWMSGKAISRFKHIRKILQYLLSLYIRNVDCSCTPMKLIVQYYTGPIVSTPVSTSRPSLPAHSLVWVYSPNSTSSSYPKTQVLEVHGSFPTHPTTKV